MTTTSTTAYKAFSIDSDGRIYTQPRDKSTRTYWTEGGTNTLTGKLVQCENAFHADKYPWLCLQRTQYDKYGAIELIGDYEEDSDGDGELYGLSMTLVKILTREEYIALMIEHVDAATNDGSTPLYCAARYNHLDIVNALIAAKANVDAVGAYGWTPLYCAARNGHLDIVNALIAAKANVDAADKYGWTPLYYAANDGHLDIVNALIAAGANVDAVGNNGWTPLDIAANDKIRAILKEAGAK